MKKCRVLATGVVRLVHKDAVQLAVTRISQRFLSIVELHRQWLRTLHSLFTLATASDRVLPVVAQYRWRITSIKCQESTSSTSRRCRTMWPWWRQIAAVELLCVMKTRRCLLLSTTTSIATSLSTTNCRVSARSVAVAVAVVKRQVLTWTTFRRSSLTLIPPMSPWQPQQHHQSHLLAVAIPLNRWQGYLQWWQNLENLPTFGKVVNE